MSELTRRSLLTTVGAGIGTLAGIGKRSTPASAGEFDAEQRVKTTADLSVRDGPGVYYSRVDVALSGTAGKILEGPTEGSYGNHWYRIRWSGIANGWSAADWLTAAPLEMAFDIGERVHATTGLNVRRKPGLDHTVLDAVPAGTSGDITDGVITTGGYTWWQIDWGDLTGWSVQKYLESESGFRPSSADAQSERGDVTWPISGQITSDWYDLRDYGYHRSIDVAAARGTEIGVARAGTVSNVLTLPDGGRSVFVDHESGYQTRYMHLSEWACEDGQRVDRGETIGYVGSTGHSTGPHLHFEIERWGSNQYVPGEEGDNVTKGDPIPHKYADL